MQPDRGLVKEFRRRYKSEAGSAQKIIGISWGSKVRARACPPFADWAELMQACPATYVSLQYGKVSAAVRRLRAMSGASLLHDSSVDQLKDMDRFAAQVASLDLVVSINNTIAHTAGALAVPTIVILGNSYTDWHTRASPRGSWSDRSDRYPNTMLIRRDGRNWSTVMDEVRSHVSSLLQVGR
jgi:ADP-heptose:LPS heptosyltransferase